MIPVSNTNKKSAGTKSSCFSTTNPVAALAIVVSTIHCTASNTFNNTSFSINVMISIDVNASKSSTVLNSILPLTINVSNKISIASPINNPSAAKSNWLAFTVEMS